MESERDVIDLGTEPPGICERCRGIKEQDGWCKVCAERRALALAVWLTAVLMASGFSACLYTFNRNVASMWVDVGMFLFWGGPVIGIVVYFLMKRKRRQGNE